ncbi:MAG: hypothetical protein FJ293_10670, partial [Planctomycetes bacterium]|nr:hypothetical protein [Planctomycetota bacterium]
MIAAAWLLLAAAALGAVGAGDERLDRALGGLEDADPHRRREAALDLRHALRPEDAARLLDARSRAAPNGAAALEQLLVEVALLRGELLRLALAGDDRAVELLTAAFAARAGELAPLRLDLAELRERRLPWTRSGWRAVRSGAPGATLQLPELLAALRGAGCLAQPVVVQAGCLADGILAPFAADVALDAWLEIELSRRDRVVRRGVVAAWVLPPKEADGDRLLDGEKEGIELLQLCERECGWFRAALLAARALPTAAGWRDGCGLLLRCGLELPAGAIPDAAAARVVAEVRAEWL